jgi:hypothetical protein
MKQKKILILSLFVGLFSLFNLSFAQNISFSVEGESSFGN